MGRMFTSKLIVINMKNPDKTANPYLPFPTFVFRTPYISFQEFAYLVLAGVDENKVYLMLQIDPRAGVYIAPEGNDHTPTTNSYTHFVYKFPTSIPEVERTSITMSVFPNPASGQATVTFEGKGNITVCNMLGQTVYHVENVENVKQIPLDNLTTGVYFVTVRSGNATATQKLVVR